MSRKDFQLIADVIRNHALLGRSDVEIQQERHDLACAFAAALSTTNPRFDRSSFLKAATA